MDFCPFPAAATVMNVQRKTQRRPFVPRKGEKSEKFVTERSGIIGLVIASTRTNFFALNVRKPENRNCVTPVNRSHIVIWWPTMTHTVFLQWFVIYFLEERHNLSPFSFALLPSIIFSFPFKNPPSLSEGWWMNADGVESVFLGWLFLSVTYIQTDRK